VRSTARIYELYHSPDAKGTGKDYLCTVRCGLAVKEPQPYGEESMSQRTGSALNSAKREHEAKSVSSGSDEDSWVDVNIPESPAGNKTLTSQERNVIRTCQVNTMVCNSFFFILPMKHWLILIYHQKFMQAMVLLDKIRMFFFVMRSSLATLSVSPPISNFAL
jgi:hypothetical protein